MVRPEFMIKHQGKDFVLFAGLIDEAHRRGIKRIDTEVIQPPTPENGNLAICKSRVELEGGLTCTGIGDASDRNVSKHMAKRLVAMAETRSKARALRDLLNISATAFEEIAEDADEAYEDAPQGPARLSARGSGEKVTQEQLETMKKLATAAGWSQKKTDDALLKWSQYTEQAGEAVIAKLEEEAGLKKDEAELSGK